MRRFLPWRSAAVVVDPVGRAAVDEPPAPGEPCLNCGDATPGNFCRSCGQARRVVHVSLREMMVDFVDDQLAFNSKLPRTLAFLLTRPGFLTREYLSGRIASYIRPLRLYLGASVAFFLLFHFTAGNDVVRVGAGAGDAAADSARDARDAAGRTAAADSLRARGLPVPPAPAPRPARTRDDDLRVTGMGEAGEVLNRKLKLAGAMSPAKRQRTFLEGFEKNFPKTMFLMLPVFAMLLKLLHLRSGRYYVEHFVFSLHIHAFGFLLLTILLALNRAPGPVQERLSPLVVLWGFVYLYFALKLVYRQGWLRTGMKYAALLGTYLVVLALALGATMLLVFLLL